MKSDLQLIAYMMLCNFTKPYLRLRYRLRCGVWLDARGADHLAYNYDLAAWRGKYKAWRA